MNIKRKPHVFHTLKNLQNLKELQENFIWYNRKALRTYKIKVNNYIADPVCRDMNLSFLTISDCESEEEEENFSIEGEEMNKDMKNESSGTPKLTEDKKPGETSV